MPVYCHFFFVWSMRKSILKEVFTNHFRVFTELKVTPHNFFRSSSVFYLFLNVIKFTSVTLISSSKLTVNLHRHYNSMCLFFMLSAFFKVSNDLFFCPACNFYMYSGIEFLKSRESESLFIFKYHVTMMSTIVSYLVINSTHNAIITCNPPSH